MKQPHFLQFDTNFQRLKVVHKENMGVANLVLGL